MGKATQDTGVRAESASGTNQGADSSLEERIRVRTRELEEEIKQDESLIETLQGQLRKLQQVRLMRIGELVGLKKLLGE